MKKIGYIHRYDLKEEKGILVYGYNKDLLRNSPAPILFSKSQCKTSVRTGVLVYFEIDKDKTVRDIEYASIFNFDKELLLSLISVIRIYLNKKISFRIKKWFHLIMSKKM